MIRRFAVGVVVCAMAVAGLASGASGTTTMSLLLPQGSAFSMLGHSCGGIQEQAFATGFDATTGYPTGDVYAQTRCGGSGRGGGYHVTTYAAWASATWDFTGALVGMATLPGAPTDVSPTFSAFDAQGSEVFNVLNAVNVLPENCTVGNTTYCSYRAYLTLSDTFVPAPRVISISTASGPAAGGTSVTITGTGFTGATAVTFGMTPPGENPDSIAITVTSLGGTSARSKADQFTYTAASSGCTTTCVSVGDASILEGDSLTHNLTFAVTLSQPATSAVSVDYSLTDWTARAARARAPTSTTSRSRGR